MLPSAQQARLATRNTTRNAQHDATRNTAHNTHARMHHQLCAAARRCAQTCSAKPRTARARARVGSDHAQARRASRADQRKVSRHQTQQIHGGDRGRRRTLAAVVDDRLAAIAPTSARRQTERERGCARTATLRVRRSERATTRAAQRGRCTAPTTAPLESSSAATAARSVCTRERVSRAKATTTQQT